MFSDQSTVSGQHAFKLQIQEASGIQEEVSARLCHQMSPGTHGMLTPTLMQQNVTAAHSIFKINKLKVFLITVLLLVFKLRVILLL